MAYVTATINHIIPADPIKIKKPAGKSRGISSSYNLSVTVQQNGGATGNIQLSMTLSIDVEKLYQFENGQPAKTFLFNLSGNSGEFHPAFQIANLTDLTNPPYPVTITVFVYDVAQGPHSANTDFAQYEIVGS